jgi:hypothetical protein
MLFLCILDALPPFAGFFPDVIGKRQWKIFAKEQECTHVMETELELGEDQRLS